MSADRSWTVYLAQDKHLDYNWCGSTTEIELRMVALIDYYLEQVERYGSRWNLDGTLWVEVYRRHRGEEGEKRLLAAIRAGLIGYAANRAVLLWGILSTELAMRACAGSVPIQRATRTANRTALIMENAGLMWGAANVLSACGMSYMGRGIFDLRADSYIHERPSCPLFWWQAPDGRRILVHWPPYAGTQTWGGYAEGFELARLAGEGWDAFGLQDFGDRNAPEVYEKRCGYIRDTVARYEACGEAYPLSSILLLGTGWDNWTRTRDLSLFVERFNADSDGSIRLVDARYEDFFIAAEEEIRRRRLELPVLEGSWGICWEEWAAHLGGMTRDFRQAARLLVQAEAVRAVGRIAGEEDERAGAQIEEGYRALLDFAEHDMGGCDRVRAALSAGVRAGAAARALDIGRTHSGEVESPAAVLKDPVPEKEAFDWRGRRVEFDAARCGIGSLVDPRRGELVSGGCGLALGQVVHTRYGSGKGAVFPEPQAQRERSKLHRFTCARGSNGVEIRAEGERYGFGFSSRWFFHASHPWIDLTCTLENGWDDEPQAVQICFPFAGREVAYEYDSAGSVQVAGPRAEGGDDLPGANPSLFAAQSFAAAVGRESSLLLLTPDAPLVQFGAGSVRRVGFRPERVPAMLTSMPLMNLTRNDHQFGQGGQRRWVFRYRLIQVSGRWDRLRPLRESQRFAAPPFLQVPGQKPVVAGLKGLEIAFAGGPVTAFKVAADGRRLVLRLWNLLERRVEGSLRLPEGYARAEVCDGLERRRKELVVSRRRAIFEVGPRALFTIAFRPE